MLGGSQRSLSLNPTTVLVVLLLGLRLGCDQTNDTMHYEFFFDPSVYIPTLSPPIENPGVVLTATFFRSLKFRLLSHNSSMLSRVAIISWSWLALTWSTKQVVICGLERHDSGIQ